MPTLKLFHTADWHLGQLLHGYDRLAEHRAFLDWLVAQIRERQPDALLVAGDVFDTINPSADAQKLFYRFLASAVAVRPALQIVITAGNHDAAARLEAPNPVLENFNIHIVGTLSRDTAGNFVPAKTLIPLRNAAGKVAALALAIPFLRPCDLPRPAEDEPFSVIAGVREIYARAAEAARALRAETLEFADTALIALGHCHVAGTNVAGSAAGSSIAGYNDTDDSEHPILIGGEGALPLDVFPADAAYVALGHIHRAQLFDNGRIRYCGSPLPLSFSEANYRHQILELTLAGSGEITVESLPVPRHAELLRIPAAGKPPLPLDGADGLFAKLNAHPFDTTLPVDRHPFLEIRVLDDAPDPTRIHRIREHLDNRPVRLGPIRSERPTAGAGAEPLSAVGTPSSADAELASIKPADLFADVHRNHYGTDPDPALLAALNEILLQQTTGTTEPNSASTAQ
jgi:exonuclease SbcD